MNSSSTFAGRHALHLALALLGGLACVAAVSAYSRSNVATLERFEETTAFGDTHYFIAPSGPADSSVPVVVLDAMPLFLAGGEKLERRDTRMVRVGQDKASGLVVYSPRERLDGKEGEKIKPGYFLKSAPDEYIKLRSGKGG